jgi:hypothetical protein
MKYFLILNLILVLSFLNSNLIFLSPSSAEYTFSNKFKLDDEDVRLIQYYFSKKDYTNQFHKLPKSSGRQKVDIYFSVLKNSNHPLWPSAYLYLLDIVPNLFIEDNGC